MASKVPDEVGIWQVVAVCVAAFAISAALRLVEVSRWDSDIHRVDGEYLLATHDAYAWAAGAAHEQLRMSAHPMSRLLGILSGFSSSSPANAAFWLPAVLAALSAIPISLWSMYLGAGFAFSLAAGVFGSIAPAFFGRTRLGYFDTDWATMLFPLLIGLLLAVWLERFCVDRFRRSDRILNSHWIFRLPILLLVLIPLGSPWHEFIPAYALIALWLSLLLLVVLGKRPLKEEAPMELLAFALPLATGWLGLALGILLLLLLSSGVMRSFKRHRVTVIGLSLVLVLLSLITWLQFEDYLSGKIVQYFQAPVRDAVGLVYPELGQSVREVQKINLLQVLGGAAFEWWLGIPALAGFIFILYRYPLAIFLAPLLLLGLLSPRLGTRFAMYATPALMLGLCASIGSVLRKIEAKWQTSLAWSNRLSYLVFVGLILTVQSVYTHFPIETVLSKEHAVGLNELSLKADGDGMLWTWWDYGYAAQYYTGLPTFADGGRNNGEYLFTLGYVLGATNPESSAALIRFAASQAYQPWESWSKWSPGQLDSWIDGEMRVDDDIPVPGEQYLAVQWEAVALLQWIQAYGSWDFENQLSRAGRPVDRPQPLELDLEKGIFTKRSRETIQLGSADILAPSGSDHYEYVQSREGLHLLLHGENGGVFLLDNEQYNSTLVQLLLGNSPAAFELVVDRRPELAIYRLR
ncbi:MAG: STT3 domain-containing protein [Anaerolineales bacterium]|jgi:dolichyl-diphosphooligosaccharide--protein glycosyltransferase